MSRRRKGSRKRDKKNKTDRQKRNIGGATRRNRPSLGAFTLTTMGKVKGRTLDFGCGFGYDAEHFGWDSYDPYYFPEEPKGEYETIVCINVLNAITRTWREYAINHMKMLLSTQGVAYLSVPRTIPLTGKICDFKRAQHHVVLTLPSVFKSKKIEIYELRKDSEYEDLTIDCVNI
jgi:hypothetical protein